MKKIGQSLVIAVLVICSVFIWAGNVWSVVNLPMAFFNGIVQTTAGIGIGSLTLPVALVNSAFYLDGTSTAVNGPDESIIGKTVTISGAVRTGDYTFSDATITITDGSFTYFSATLSNIELITDGVQWFLNPGLDVNDPTTLNLSNLVLNTDATHPSRYIDELQSTLGNISGMKMRLNVFSGDITGDSSAVILEGLIAAGPPIPAPTITEWGMIIFMVLAGFVSIYFLRRKRIAA